MQVIHKENGGLSSARNAALDIAQGEYIGFVDSDDYISVDMFEKLYQACVQYESEIAICCHYTERGDRLLIEEPIVDESIQYTGVEALELLIRDQGIRNYAWDKLYKASLFRVSDIRTEGIMKTLQRPIFYSTVQNVSAAFPGICIIIRSERVVSRVMWKIRNGWRTAIRS